MGEYVMVPREWLQDLVSAGAGEPVSRRDLETAAKALAEQHQGEPVAWLDPSCGLTWLANRMDFAPGTKFYTHADPVEVSELTTERDRLRDGLDNANINIANWAKSDKDLRAKVAEAHALLREASGAIERISANLVTELQALDQLKGALSASAEPSAPVERDERAEFERWYAEWFNDIYLPVKPLTAESMKMSRNGNGYGAGSLGKNSKWAGWQARAALERKP